MSTTETASERWSNDQRNDCPRTSRPGGISFCGVVASARNGATDTLFLVATNLISTDRDESVATTPVRRVRRAGATDTLTPVITELTSHDCDESVATNSVRRVRREGATDTLTTVAITTATPPAPEATPEQVTCSTPLRSAQPTARSSRDLTLLRPDFVEGPSGIEEATQALAELLDLLRRSEPTDTSITTSSNADEA